MNLKPIGENGPSSPMLLTRQLLDALPTLPERWTDESQGVIAGLLSAAITVGVSTEQVLSVAAQITARHPGASSTALSARIAAALAHRGDTAAARALLPNAPGAELSDDPGLSWLHSARARALHALGDDAGRDDAFTAARASEQNNPGRLAEDLLAVGDFMGALDVVRSTHRVDKDARIPLYRDIIEQAYRADRLDLGLEVLHLSDDMLLQHRLLRELLAAPLAERDGPAVLAMVRAAPVAYQGDLLAFVVPQLVTNRMYQPAREAVALWGSVESTSLLRLGAAGLVSDPGPALAVLKSALSLRLEQEEELGIVDAWAYRELGQALGWLGELGPALAALERVADQEERLRAQLSAARHAPSVTAEALICAARGLVASLEDEPRRVRASVRLGVLLCQLGRRAESRSLFDEALRIADGIRRPRSDQGQTRRAALQVVIRSQLAVGEHTGAAAAGRKLRTRRHQDPALAAIARDYAAAGDLAGACWCLSTMEPGLQRLRALHAAAETWLASGRPLRVTGSDAA